MSRTDILEGALQLVIASFTFQQVTVEGNDDIGHEAVAIDVLVVDGSGDGGRDIGIEAGHIPHTDRAGITKGVEFRLVKQRAETSPRGSSNLTAIRQKLDGSGRDL